MLSLPDPSFANLSLFMAIAASPKVAVYELTIFLFSTSNQAIIIVIAMQMILIVRLVVDDGSERQSC